MPQVVSFGEVLWDCLPEGLFLGGAPFNVVAHAARLGAEAFIVTSVGNDFLGQEAVERLKALGVRDDFVATDPELPTGVVKVALDDEGNAHYNIVENVAWDRIPVTEEALRVIAGADAIILGSLAARSPFNFEAALKILELDGPLKVLDVNLRPPWDDSGRVLELAQRVDLLKTNAEEARKLSGKHDLETAARTLADRCGCRRVCVTLGAQGAMLLQDNVLYTGRGPMVLVEDTVGAGDAFLACLITSLLDGSLPIEMILEKSCRLGGYVASQRGAVPRYDPLRF
jgi:fructokinase